MEIVKVCWRQEDTFDLSACQYVDGNQGCIFSRVFLDRASNDLNTCWVFQKGFYFDLHQQGMEWSRLGLSPSEPPWTHQSPAPVQGWDATALIYYSEVIHRLWIKRQLKMLLEKPKAGLGQFGMDDMHELRQRDKTDRQRCPSLLIAPGNFLFLWSVLCNDEKQRWKWSFQSRPLMFAEMFANSSRWKVRSALWERNHGQVCISSLTVFEKWNV